jgi:glycolate oxidase
MKSLFESALGAEKLVSDPQALAAYDDDYSEMDGAVPALAVLPTCPEDVQAIVRIAIENKLSLVPRVAGTNVGGLTIPDPNGVVVDLRRMNRILSVNTEDMVAVLEPGVTQQQLRDYLDEHNIPLTIGYSLGPTRSSILANCCLDGLTNRSLKYGSMGEWVAGFEVVLADGSLIKTGSWALSDIPFAKSPFPDLSGLFIGWQGSTGIVTKVAVHLVPAHKITERLFILTYSTHGTFEAMRRLSKLEICDDIGGLSWPTGKMMLGVEHPFPVPEDGEPRFFLYVDLTGENHEEIQYKKHILADVIDALRKEGEHYEDPLDIPTLVALSPPMSKFASFPTDLDFLTDHSGGGLTWIGTYGPLSRFDKAADAGIEAMTRHGFAPAIVSRSMKGGHFAVLRFLATFDKKNPEQIARIREMNHELLQIVTDHGFVMYKTPAWALKQLLPKMDPGFIELMRKTKHMLDPNGVFNPGRLLLS